MKWNNQEVERIPSIIRSSSGLTFNASYKKYFGKAAIGAWLIFETDHVSQQAQNGFTHALVKADGVPVARASAAFRLPK